MTLKTLTPMLTVGDMEETIHLKSRCRNSSSNSSGHSFTRGILARIGRSFGNNRAWLILYGDSVLQFTELLKSERRLHHGHPPLSASVLISHAFDNADSGAKLCPTNSNKRRRPRQHHFHNARRQNNSHASG